MLYISLGRNVGDEPMADDVWRDFRIAVEETIMDNETLVTADTYAPGTSNWNGDAEDTLVLVWFDKMSPLRQVTVKQLESIAKEFKQEAIAWAVAEPKFVKGV
jgi:hypothetical protein